MSQARFHCAILLFKVPPRFELGLPDSKSDVLTTTLWDRSFVLGTLGSNPPYQRGRANLDSSRAGLEPAALASVNSESVLNENNSCMFLFKCQLTSVTTTNTLTGNRTLATSVKAMYPNHWTMRVGYAVSWLIAGSN